MGFSYEGDALILCRLLGRGFFGAKSGCVLDKDATYIQVYTVCLYIYLSICLCLFIYVCRSIYLCLSIYFYLSIYLGLFIFVVSFHLSVYLSTLLLLLKQPYFELIVGPVLVMDILNI